jgi:polyhydroxyalkanoate synthesis regulator protein
LFQVDPPVARVGAGRRMAGSEQPIVITRYGGNRLHFAAEGRYVSLDGVGCVVEDDEDFVVSDVASGKDITATILKQIITERAHHG